MRSNKLGTGVFPDVKCVTVNLMWYPVRCLSCSILFANSIELRIVKIQLQLWKNLVDKRISSREIHSKVVRSVVVLDVHGMKGGNGAGNLTSDLTIVNKRKELVISLNDE